MNHNLYFIYGFAEALNLMFKTQLHFLNLIRFHSLRPAEQLVQLLLNCFFLRLHNINLCVFLVELHLHGGQLYFITQFPLIFLFKALLVTPTLAVRRDDVGLIHCT